MKKLTTTCTSSALSPIVKATFIAGFLPALVLLLSIQSSYAGSATWNLDPTNGADWNTATNWTPNTVPNAPADLATFSLSNHPTPTLSAPVALSEMIFTPGASAFTINFKRGRSLNLYGAGITNNSGIAQNFAVDLFRGVAAQVVFHNSATAGNGTVFSVNSPYPIAGAFFLDSSSAGTSTLVTNGNPGVYGGYISFYDSSTAAEATIINNGGIVINGQGGYTDFLGSGAGSATAGNATITAHGGTVSGALGGSVAFGTAAHAGDATLIADGGVEGAGGGVIAFFGVATGDRARVELFDSGSLNFTFLGGALTIGSLEGNGTVGLGSNSLTIGSNNLSTTFAGIIQDAGSITKTGRGKLSLTGANTYSGGTTVTQGTLLVRNTSGSGTGTGPVTVDAGSLGGTGVIAGAVALGTGTGRGAVLSPGSKVSLGTLTIQSLLTFNADAIYDFALNSSRVAADQVVANGVTINSAIFSFVDNGGATLPLGTTFTVIDNTSAAPISGTFSNLPDGSTIAIGSNTFQANYEGGDGNDLTLAVQ
jgi:autotransporter-associated beta strand protein